MKSFFKLALTIYLFVSPHLLASEPVFVHLAEGFTSTDENVGIVAGQRMFSIPDLAEICAPLQAPARLIVATPDPLQLVQGQWFSYDRLVVLAVDSSGAVLAPVPVTVEVEEVAPPVLNLRSDMTADPDGKVLPVSEGGFRFRFRAICEGHSATAVVKAQVVAF